MLLRERARGGGRWRCREKGFPPGRAGRESSRTAGPAAAGTPWRPGIRVRPDTSELAMEVRNGDSRAVTDSREHGRERLPYR